MFPLEGLVSREHPISASHLPATPQAPLPVLPLVQSHQSCCAPSVSRLRDPLEEEHGCDLAALFLSRWLAIKSAKLWGCHSRTGQDWWVWAQERQGPSRKRPQHFMLEEYKKNRERESLGSPLLTPWCWWARTQTGDLAVNPDSEFVSPFESETPPPSTPQCFSPWQRTTRPEVWPSSD